MIRRNRRPDWRRIKTLRSYTARSESIETPFATGSRTDCRPSPTNDRIWSTAAMSVAFLESRREAVRQKCGAGQIFCLRCRLPQTTSARMVEYEEINASRGILIGICPVCEAQMRRFVSRRD
jgi:hypothetical protein